MQVEPNHGLCSQVGLSGKRWLRKGQSSYQMPQGGRVDYIVMGVHVVILYAALMGANGRHMSRP